jgi:hypothetical protein
VSDSSPTAAVHSGSVALGEPQTNSSSLQGGLLSTKATPEPNPYRSNLRSRDRNVMSLQARVQITSCSQKQRRIAGAPSALSFVSPILSGRGCHIRGNPFSKQ